MTVNVTIIGAGVIGLAVAARLSASKPDIFVLEKNEKFGQETSGRNSEVIHSGVYYPENSLKARLCVKGNRMLYEYCRAKGVPYRKCGKIMVAACREEIPVLENVLRQSVVNDVRDGEWLSGSEVSRLEPEVKAEAGILFPSTGVIDSYALMKSLCTDALNNGAEIVYKTEVVAVSKLSRGYEITVRDLNGTYSFRSLKVINSAGLWADRVASLAGTMEPGYEIFFWKGEYFSVKGEKSKKIGRLIYPVPLQHSAGLGIHATVDLNGRLKLGPNALFLSERIPDYTVKPAHSADFLRSAGNFLPFLHEDDLEPYMAGIRPKLQKPGDTVRDFVIKNEKAKGFKGFINLIGMESPGLTSCLAVAEHVYEILE